jgi:SAM-dependent methyltransferase
MSVQARNAQVWQALYASGKSDLRYPSEVLVRLAAQHFPRGQSLRILDYGFGTGANLTHLLGLGHEVFGVEVSASALARTQDRLQAAGLEADLRLMRAGDRLPFEARMFDAVVAWGVLGYNDLAGWQAAVAECERVLRPGGLMLVAIAAPGDVSHQHAETLGGSLYRSRVPGQEGCVLTIPSREELADLFPGRALEVGEFSHSFGETQSRHWIIRYRTSP